MNTVNWREPRLYFAAIVAAVGICGLLASPLLIIYGLGIGVVLVVKIAFLGFVLSGIYGISTESNHTRWRFWGLVMQVVLWLIYMAIAYFVYEAVYWSSMLLMDFAISMAANISLPAGFILITAILSFGVAQRVFDRPLAVASLVALILVGLSWFAAEYAVYGILSDYLNLSEYYTVSQISSEALLVGVLMASFVLVFGPSIERFMVRKRRSLDEIH